MQRSAAHTRSWDARRACGGEAGTGCKNGPEDFLRLGLTLGCCCPALDGEGGGGSCPVVLFPLLFVPTLLLLVLLPPKKMFSVAPP